MPEPADGHFVPDGVQFRNTTGLQYKGFPLATSTPSTSAAPPPAAKPRSLGDVLQEFSQHRKLMQEELQKVIVGQDEVIEQIFAAIFTRGHCLLVGVPGLAKTLMVSTLARILDIPFKRIQFTPDLMPSDITGTNVLEEDDKGRREFRFVEGPIFTSILLADEINRTPPKTQAALLQAMQEREVTVGQKTYSLPEPFFTIATQNPIEQEGTYPLPEAQLDRFMFNIKVDYPTADEEERILAQTTRGEKVEVRKILSGKAIVNLQGLVGKVAVSEYIVQYVAPPGAIDAAQRRNGAESSCRNWSTGRRPACRHIPDQGRQGPGRHGRAVFRGHRRHPEGRRARVAASHLDQFPGPGRRNEQRGPDCPTRPRDAPARDTEI